MKFDIMNTETWPLSGTDVQIWSEPTGYTHGSFCLSDNADPYFTNWTDKLGSAEDADEAIIPHETIHWWELPDLIDGPNTLVDLPTFYTQKVPRADFERCVQKMSEVPDTVKAALLLMNVQNVAALSGTDVNEHLVFLCEHGGISYGMTAGVKGVKITGEPS